MKKRFYIFLDIDGVLNNAAFFENLYEKEKNDLTLNQLDDENVQAFRKLHRKISEVFDTQIVISSSWRNLKKKLLRSLEEKRLDIENLEYTGKDEHEGRGLEIKKFLNGKDDVLGYVILDDEVEDIKVYINDKHIVETDFYADGLTNNHVNKFLNSKYFSKLVIEKEMTFEDFNK